MDHVAHRRACIRYRARTHDRKKTWSCAFTIAPFTALARDFFIPHELLQVSLEFEEESFGQMLSDFIAVQRIHRGALPLDLDQPPRI